MRALKCSSIMVGINETENNKYAGEGMMGQLIDLSGMERQMKLIPKPPLAS